MEKQDLLDPVGRQGHWAHQVQQDPSDLQDPWVNLDLVVKLASVGKQGRWDHLGNLDHLVNEVAQDHLVQLAQ